MGELVVVEFKEEVNEEEGTKAEWVAKVFKLLKYTYIHSPHVEISASKLTILLIRNTYVRMYMMWDV